MLNLGRPQVLTVAPWLLVLATLLLLLLPSTHAFSPLFPARTTPNAAAPAACRVAGPPVPPLHANMVDSMWSNLHAEGNIVSEIEDTVFKDTNSRIKMLSRAVSIFVKRKEPGTLILIRHGESMLNYNKTFTGWIDADLNERGVRETEHAARLLMERGYEIDVTYTSRLKRAIRSSWIVMTELGQIYRPVYKSWRLNERMYGALEGMSKPGLAQELGEEVVQGFRQGLTTTPPPMTPDHPHWHLHEKKYADVKPEQIPVTESLQDTMERTLPLWHNRILPDLRSGQTVMIVAHANSLRGILKHMDNLDQGEIQAVAIPNGIPLVYKFDRNMRPIKQDGAVAPLSGEFLEKKGLLRSALAKEAELAASVPGYSTTSSSAATMPVMDARLRGLAKLSEARQLIAATSFGGGGFVAAPVVPQAVPATRVLNPSSGYPTSGSTTPPSTDKDPIIVIIRHGKTEYNKLGVFTGWEDAPLANEGRIEARNSGKLLKRHGIEIDVVYTSWLSRAIETAWLVLDELDCLWLPIVKSWRLNERHYGALTGLSKKMIAQRHGDAKFKRWRRSYATRPPEVSSFSSNYPGNDDRYVKYVTDMRFSFRETLIRSLSDMKLKLHRRFPKAESLKDCMSRTIPFYTDQIVPQSVAKGKTVLIASSENAIRGLFMTLCDIPADRIAEVEIPTGLPLVYNIRKRCIQLLETGEEDPSDPIGHLDFGSSPELLFQPCDSENDAECFLGADGKSYRYDPLIRMTSEMRQKMQAEKAAALEALAAGAPPTGYVPSSPSKVVAAGASV